jgi:hypothetical protein
MAARTATEPRLPTGQKLDALFVRLATQGIKIGITERVSASRLVAELAVQPSADLSRERTAALLRARLTPLLAKSPEEADVIHRAFLDAFPRQERDQPVPVRRLLRELLGPAGASLRGIKPAPDQAPAPLVLRTKARARQIRYAVTTASILLLIAAALIGVHWFLPSPVQPQPAPRLGPTETTKGGAGVTTSAAQPLTREEVANLIKQVIDAAAGKRSVSIAGLAHGLSGADASGITTRSMISLLQRYLSRAQQERFTLTDVELTNLVAALAARQYPGRAAPSDVVAAAIGGLDALDPSEHNDPLPALPAPAESIFIPLWLTASLLGLAALPLVWWASRYRWRLKDYLRRRTPERPPLVHELVVKASADAMRERTTLTRAALRLGRARQGLSRTLDIETSVNATARAAGFPHVVFAAERISPEYLVLISTKGEEDHTARQLDQLVAELAAQNLSITRFFMAHEANLCFETADGSYFRLDQLAARYPDHRLVFLGTGDQLLNPGTLDAWRWAEDVTAWPRRAILTPRPIEEWGQREVVLARLFDSPPLRADSIGLLRMAELFERQEPPGPEQLVRRSDPVRRSWTMRPQRWLTPLPPDGPAFERLADELARYFVDERSNPDAVGFWWLAACAMYPALRWDLTVYLGLKLKAPRGSGAGGLPFYTEQRALRLAALPWFRDGFMPDWLRRRLLARLPRQIRHQAAALLHDLLKRAVKPDGQVFDALRLRIARERPDPAAARPERDEIFLDALARSDPLAFEAPRNLREVISGIRNAFVGRELLTFAILVAYWLAAAMIIPWPSSGALTTATWLPLLFLPLGFVTLPAARRVLSWGRATNSPTESTRAERN